MLGDAIAYCASMVLVLGASPTLQRALQVALEYLGAGRTKRISADQIAAVEADGTLVLKDGRRVRTSGSVRGAQAGQKVNVLWSRTKGMRGVTPVAVLRHQTNRGGGATPVARRPVTASVEELLILGTGAPLTWGVWFRDASQFVRIITSTADETPYLIAWGETDNTFVVAVSVSLATIPPTAVTRFDVYQLTRPTGTAYLPGVAAQATRVRSDTSWTIHLPPDAAGSYSLTVSNTFGETAVSVDLAHNTSASLSISVSTSSGAGGDFTPASGTVRTLALTNALDVIALADVQVEQAQITTTYSPTTEMWPVRIDGIIPGRWVSLSVRNVPDWVFGGGGVSGGALAATAYIGAETIVDSDANTSAAIAFRLEALANTQPRPATASAIFNVTQQRIEWLPPTTLSVIETSSGSVTVINAGDLGGTAESTSSSTASGSAYSIDALLAWLTDTTASRLIATETIYTGELSAFGSDQIMAVRSPQALIHTLLHPKVIDHIYNSAFIISGGAKHLLWRTAGSANDDQRIFLTDYKTEQLVLTADDTTLLVAMAQLDPIIIQPDEVYAAGETQHVIANAWGAGGSPTLTLTYDLATQAFGPIPAKPGLDGTLADVPAALSGVAITSATVKAVHLVGAR